MKKVCVQNYEKLSVVTAQIMLSEIMQDKRANIVITGGNSPKLAYQILSESLNEMGEEVYDNAHFYNFDNLGDKYPEKLGYTMNELNENFFNKVNIKQENIHASYIDNVDEIKKNIKESGGLDLVIMGIGDDGHFAGNLPGLTDFFQEIYLVPIDENEEYVPEVYAGIEPPYYAVTYGAAMLMRAKKIVLVVNGKHKAEALKKFIETKTAEDFPTSIFKMHQNFVVIYDKEAAELLDA